MITKVQNFSQTMYQSSNTDMTPAMEILSTKPVSSGKRKKIVEKIIEKSIQCIAMLSIAFIILLFIFVLKEAFPLILSRVTDEVGIVGIKNLFSSMKWSPVSLHPSYGIVPLIIGSIKVTIVALCIATPISITSALYTTLFAPRWLREIVKPSIEILAGFPSIVIGFFALNVLATFLQTTFHLHFRLNALVGGIALSLAVIPIIYTITEDSLNAIPKNFIDAGLALGAQKWETGIFIMIPAALPGIIAAVLLGIGRAFGETMIVLMATGNAAILSESLVVPVRTLSATIGAEMAEVVFGDAHYSVLYCLGLFLFGVSFTLNAVVEFFVKKRMLRTLKGK